MADQNEDDKKKNDGTEEGTEDTEK